MIGACDRSKMVRNWCWATTAVLGALLALYWKWRSQSNLEGKCKRSDWTRCSAVYIKQSQDLKCFINTELAAQWHEQWRRSVFRIGGTEKRGSNGRGGCGILGEGQLPTS